MTATPYGKTAGEVSDEHLAEATNEHDECPLLNLVRRNEENNDAASDDNAQNPGTTFQRKAV